MPLSYGNGGALQSVTHATTDSWMFFNLKIDADLICLTFKAEFTLDDLLVHDESSKVNDINIGSLKRIIQNEGWPEETWILRWNKKVRFTVVSGFILRKCT